MRKMFKLMVVAIAIFGLTTFAVAQPAPVNPHTKDSANNLVIPTLVGTRTFGVGVNDGGWSTSVTGNGIG